MTSVGAYEAKTHLSRLLEQVERGATVTITKHGREIARLVPAAPAQLAPGAVIDELRRARSGTKRGRTPVRRMIEEGRR